LTESQQKELKPVFEELVPKEKFNVSFEPMSEDEMPVSITQSEFMRRMMEMQSLGGGMMGAFPESYNLVVNANHPLITKVLLNSNKEENKKLLSQAIDLAKLSANLLKGEELTKFIERNIESLK
jgi:molecular chaperone HtpG